MAIRVLIVDDHAMVRRSVRALLERTAGLEVCGEAVDGVEAVALAGTQMPDVIVTDISMPRMNGLEATREIVRLYPSIRIVVLSQHDAPEMMRVALDAGAHGYVVKSDISAHLVEAIERVGHGERADATPVVLGKTGAQIDVKELMARSTAFETALRESEARLRSLVEYQSAVVNNMAEGLYTVDAEGLLTSINPAGVGILGWSKEELIGKKMHDVTHYLYPDGTPFPASACQGLQVLQRGVTLREHHDTFVRKNGSFVPVVFSASPLRDGGKISGVVVCFRDETEQRRAREALVKSKRELEETAAHLRLVTETMAASVTRCSREMRYLWVNERYAEWLGRPVEQIVGQRLEDVLGEAAFTKLRPRFAEVLAGKEVSYEDEVELLGIGRRWVAAVYTPTLDSSGVADGWVAAVRDISARKLGQERLRQSEAELRQVQLELEQRVEERTQELTSANAQLSALTGRLLRYQDSERRRLARELHDSAGQLVIAIGMGLDGVIEDVKKHDDGVAGTVRECRELVTQLTREIRTISYLLHPPLLDGAGLPVALRMYVQGLAGRGALHITLDISEELGRLGADGELTVFRIVQECLSNVHRHSGSPTAGIRLWRDGGVVRLEIEDRGRGIPAEILRGIREQASGVGIGGMRERVRQLGGEMKIESGSGGTRISVWLPAAVAGAGAGAERKLEAPTS